MTPSLPDDAIARRSQAWSDYWSSGALHSCGGSYAGNYGGEIAAFWHGVFAGLAPDARVLDLCCGNAPLAKLLLDQPGEARIGAIDAVDAARISPRWVSELTPALRARLHLHPGVDVRALPFPDATFGLCTSQFGIEYVGAAAMAEAGRVLRAGARFAAVLHHEDALPVRIARAECEHLVWLEQPGGLLERAEAMLAPMARSATPEGRAALRGDAQANAQRAAFNAALQALEARLASAVYPDVLHEARDALMAALQHARVAGESAGRTALARLRRSLAADALRQGELLESALDEAGLRALLAPLGDPAPSLRVLEFEGGDIAGWAVTARRA